MLSQQEKQLKLFQWILNSIGNKNVESYATQLSDLQDYMSVEDFYNFLKSCNFYIDCVVSYIRGNELEYYLQHLLAQNKIVVAFFDHGFHDYDVWLGFYLKDKKICVFDSYMHYNENTIDQLGIKNSGGKWSIFTISDVIEPFHFIPEPPNHINPGIWIKVWIDGKLQNNIPKCILEPSKLSTEIVGDNIFIGTIYKTRYFKSYEIKIAYYTGFSEDKLGDAQAQAIIQYYARSNYPFWAIIRRAIHPMKYMHCDPFLDKYEIFIKCENASKYTFEIYDNEAIKYRNSLLTKDEREVQNHLKRKIEAGSILPGFKSYRSFFGFGQRKYKNIYKLI